MTDFKFDVDEYNKLVKACMDEYPDKDIHLLEYIVGSYLIYDKGGIERPKDETEEFKKSNEIIERLIEETKLIK